MDDPARIQEIPIKIRHTKNTNQGKTNRTGSKPQRAQSSRQTSQNRYNVDEEFMNMGNEEMGDFC